VLAKYIREAGIIPRGYGVCYRLPGMHKTLCLPIRIPTDSWLERRDAEIYMQARKDLTEKISRGIG
jgi:hypothetical protein